MSLYAADSSRKYLAADERAAFLKAAETVDRRVRALSMTLAWTGCRLSEALALTADRVDLAAGVLVFETLKKRRSGVYRAVPAPCPCWRPLASSTGPRGPRPPGPRPRRASVALEPDDRLAART